MDLEQEKQRLQKTMKEVNKEIASLKGKLSNKGFIARAPQEVVDNLLKQKLMNKKRKRKIMTKLKHKIPTSCIG